MIKISEDTLSRFTADETKAQYIKSRAFELKCFVRKTSIRTGLSASEISALSNQKKAKTYLNNLTSFKRFKNKGDIEATRADSITKKLVAIPSK